MREYQFHCGRCHQLLVADAACTSERVACPQCEARLIAPPCPVEPRGRAVGAAPVLLSAEPDEDEAVSFGDREGTDEPEMDMTPMVDVTFLLLIFFMVTAAFAMQKSFKVPTPKPDEPSSQRTIEDVEDDPNVVVVRIDEFNTFYVVAAAWDEEKECPSKQELLVKLREARNSGEGGTVANTLVVMAHGDAMHGKVVMAMDAGSEVGMDEIKLSTFEGDE